MRLLPLRLREVAKRISNPFVEIIGGAFDTVAFAARVCSLEAFCWRHVQEQRQIGHKRGRRETIGGANLRFRQASSNDLVRVRRKKKTIEQNYVAVVQRGPYLACNQLRTRRHEQK